MTENMAVRKINQGSLEKKLNNPRITEIFLGLRPLAAGGTGTVDCSGALLGLAPGGVLCQFITSRVSNHAL